MKSSTICKNEKEKKCEDKEQYEEQNFNGSVIRNCRHPCDLDTYGIIPRM